MYTFVPNKYFGQLLDILPKKFVFLKTLNKDCSNIEVWIAHQDFNMVEIEDKINITLVIKWSVKYKKDALFGST